MMKTKKINISLLLLFSYCTCLFAQDTPWGKASIVSVDEATKNIKFSYAYMNDFFYIKQGETDKDLIVGNEQMEVLYSVVQEGKLHLTKLHKGSEYMTQFKVDSQSKYGFKFHGDAEGLNALMSKFVGLTHKAYHPSKYFKAGPSKDGKLFYALVLLGEGKAYYGAQNDKGVREGYGTYVMANKDKYAGPWKEDTQNGKFTVTREGEFRAQGNFFDGQQDGLWKFVYADESYIEKVYVKGEKQSEKKFFKARNPDLKTGLEKSKIYKSVYTEEKKDGEWKERWPYRQEYWVNQFKGSHTIKHRDAFDETITHDVRLVNVQEDAAKRVETYDYTYEFGHSEPVITIFKSPQKTPDGENNYDIMFYFPHKSGEYRYYFQHDDEQDKKDRETMKKIQETRDMINEILKKEEEKKKQNKN